MSSCSNGPDYYTSIVPVGAVYTCSELDDEYEHSHAIGSFSLSAQTDFYFDAYTDVTYPTYPLLHIDVCERTIYLESAWTQEVCSEERGGGSSSEYSGGGTLGAVPVYGQNEESSGGIAESDISNGYQSSSSCDVCGGAIDTSCACGTGSGQSPGETEPEPECDDDSDCDPLQRCVNGECVPLECVFDADCPAGQECFNGECVDL